MGSRVLDRRLVRVYLSDHVAAAEGMSRRVSKMATAYPRTPLGRSMAELEPTLRRERAWLLRLAKAQHVRLSKVKSASAAVAEQLGRLKLNGRLTRTSPLTPLLELELLASGLRGKRSGWRTLREWADELQIERDELDQLLSDVDAQIEEVELLLVQHRRYGLSST